MPAYLPYVDPQTSLAGAIGPVNNPTLRSESVAGFSRAANSAPPREAAANRTFQDAIRRISEYEDGLRIDQVRPASIRVEANRLISDKHEYSLAGEGFRRLCHCVGAPPAYLAKLPVPLIANVLQHHIDQRHYRKQRLSDKNATIMSRAGRFLGFGRSDLQSLTGAEVVSAVVEGIGESAADLSVSGLSFGGESFALEFITPRIAAEVRPGDVINAGLRVAHSHLGLEAT